MNLEIKIEKSAFGGDGIGYEDGKTCFVEGALPGEVVIAKVLQDKKNFIKAKIVKVVEASPFRLSPPCPYYETCGGCQYQHVTYEEELRIKESQVREMMQRGPWGPPNRFLNPSVIPAVTTATATASPFIARKKTIQNLKV